MLCAHCAGRRNPAAGSRNMAQGDDSAVPSLSDLPELGSIFILHVWPHLDLESLKAASRTCQAWHGLISSSEAVWQSSARQTLPRTHPVFSACQEHFVSALKEAAQTQHNIRKGRATCTTHLYPVLHQPNCDSVSFSPDVTRAALMARYSPYSNFLLTHCT